MNEHDKSAIIDNYDHVWEWDNEKMMWRYGIIFKGSIEEIDQAYGPVRRVL